MTKEKEGQVSMFDLDLWSSRMSQDYYQAETISESSSNPSPESRTRLPLFLDLREGSGLLAEPLWETDGLSLGAYTMQSFGESPKEVLFERGGKEGGGKGILIQKDEVGAIASSATQRVQVETAVRRLTPLEAERLQGFPDGWTDIGEWTDSKGRTRQTTDSARYKALGNSLAVGYANQHRGFWMWLIKRITERLGRTGTLGSLFDGIGGFPLAWETYNGKGSARWASEIEDFCIAVTKKRFGEE